MADLNVKLAVFEGPLDLLLHLIKTLEIDIYDIPIAEVTKQYMTYIDSMSILHLDVAGEYIVMAATLMSIKSKMLLPKQEMILEDDLLGSDGEDPRDALVAQLLEYRKFKYAANVLKDREEERGQYYTKEPVNIDAYKEKIVPLQPDQVSTIDLFLAFHDILERKKLRGPQETSIVSDSITVEQQIRYIQKKLAVLPAEDGLAFSSLFVSYSRDEIVTTFMALLELMKERKVFARQSDHYEPIFLFNYQELELE